VHCIVVMSISEKSIGASRELSKNTHVQMFGLIEEIDSNSWFCVCSLCIDAE
jgi:hypothetical protein